MLAIDHDRVKEIFFEACLRAPAARQAFLEVECAGVAELRHEVESLLSFYGGVDAATGPRALRTMGKPRFRRGQILGARFRIERLLGRGGMGEVYAAFDRVLGVVIALKTLRTADERHRLRLHEEVRLARQISHPGICRVYDVGEHEGMPFLTMELIAGEDLAARLDRTGPLPSAEVAAIGARLGEALAAAHDAGILHRDLKPANILVDRNGHLHITDFGIASLRSSTAAPGDGEARGRVGTPAYMAPEATDATATPTEKADLYSMGLVLYELLKGTAPFEAPDRSALEEMHRSLAPVPPSRTMTGIDARLESWVLRLLAKDPAARPSSAREVANALADLQGHAFDPPAAHPPEHRPLVALLCELDSHGASDAGEDRERVTSFRVRSAGICVLRGGRVARPLDRGLLVHFGYPQASEQDAEAAVRAGLEILDEASRQRSRTAIAVHAGTAFFRKGRSGTVGVSGGVDVEPLRRMLVPSAVVVSSATFPLLREALQSERLEASPVGEDQAGASMRVRRSARRGLEIDVAHPGLTPFAGRELELAQLLRRWEDVCGWHGQVVTVSGEAGVGKSRLVHELWSRISVRATGLEVHCRGFHHSSPLAPFLDLVHRAASLEDWDDDAARRGKLRALLEPTGGLASEIFEPFATWLAPAARSGASPSTADGASRSFVRALADWILTLADQKPLLLVVDDLQWSDPTSLEALDLLVQECGASRVLVVLSFRSELSPRWTGSRVSPIALQPLRSDEARSLVRASAAGAALSDQAVERIVASADGNPLFLEELVREAGEAGFARSTLRTGTPGVPLTLLALLQSRLDRLGPAKLVAQAAAVCGPTFRQDLLAAILGADRVIDVQRGLDRLHDENILYRRGAPANSVYTFRQPLMREAIRGAMHRRRERELHARLAELLPSIDPGAAAARPEEVANHWMIAGRHADAFPWWRRAARLALQRAAFTEAQTHLGQARQTFRAWDRGTGGDSSDVELEILIGTLSASAGLRVSAADQRPLLRRMRYLCKRVSGDSEALVLAHVCLVRVKSMAGDPSLLRLLRQTEEVAERLGDPRLIAAVCAQIGMSLALRGRYGEAETYCERCLASDARATPAAFAALILDPRTVAAYARSLCHWAQGRASQLARGMAGANAEADAIGHPYSRVHGRIVNGVPLLLAGAYDEASRTVSEGLQLAESDGITAMIAMGRLLEALLESARGIARPERAERALAAWEASGQRHLLGVGRLALATALEREGEDERALSLLENECIRAPRRLSRFPTPELHRRRGDLLNRLGRVQEGEAALRRALRLAREDGNVTVELRAAASLARLLAPRARHDEAQRVLARSIADLSPDVDTPERAEAVALLAELGARGPLNRSRLMASEDVGSAAHREVPARAAAVGNNY